MVICVLHACYLDLILSYFFQVIKVRSISDCRVAALMQHVVTVMCLLGQEISGECVSLHGSAC